MNTGKIFVIFDSRGQIKGTAASFHEKAKAKAIGHRQVVEIIHPGLSGTDLMKHLIALHQTNRVDVTSKPKVVAK